MDNRQNTTNINWYPGHMAKTKREIKEKIDLIDIVFEIIDARIPLSSKNKDVNDLIKNKPKILVMTKKDLCDTHKTAKYINYYKDNGYNVVLIDLLKDNVKDIIMESISTLIAEINEKRKLKGLRPRKVRVLVLGIPNVGKSTLINRLVGKKATNIGNKPGITKKLEWIRINDKMELLDTPGILWPKLDSEEISFNLAAMSAIKEEILNVDEVAIYIINKMKKEYPKELSERYNIASLDIDIVEILNHIGKKIGAIKGNEINYDKVYHTILKDLKDGYLGKVTFD